MKRQLLALASTALGLTLCAAAPASARYIGTDPTTSGGHYQHSGATGPLAEREVWLDVTSDERGRGVATATVPWAFAPGTAGSVVIHALPTNATTGAAGARLTCTSVAFGG